MLLITVLVWIGWSVLFYTCLVATAEEAPHDDCSECDLIECRCYSATEGSEEREAA